MADAVSGPPRGGPSLMQSLAELLGELPGLVSDRVHLFALELRRARRALAQMLGLILGAAILLVTAWLAAWVGFTALLLEIGLAWGWVLAIVLLLNVGAAAFALLRVRALAPLLTLPATKRSLTVAPARRAPVAGGDAAASSLAVDPASAATLHTSTLHAGHSHPVA